MKIMGTALTLAVAAAGFGIGVAHANPDCAKVKALTAAGKDPRQVAEAMNLDTMDVEGCLAGVPQVGPDRGPGMAAELGGDADDNQLGSDIPERGPLFDQE
jgi:hypothetical protein